MSKVKYPKSEMDRANNVSEAAYVGFEDKGAMVSYAKALSEVSHGSRGRRNFENLDSRMDGRPGLLSEDFDWFRPGQASPSKSKDIMAYARFIYRRVGLIHNAIDLMGDFSCQGVRLIHPVDKIERFYNSWFEHVQGKHVSERLAHLLFREANVPIRTYTARLNKKKKEEMTHAIGKADMQLPSRIKSAKNEVPWRYSFLDPTLLEPVGQDLANLTTSSSFTLKIPLALRNKIKRLQQDQSAQSKAILKQISPDILQAVKTDSNVVLPEDKTDVYYYKKDDWQVWADPLVYSAFEPLNLYQRLQLADKAALDSASSKIRVWKLGSLEFKLAPTAFASSTLASMLGANVGGGTKDIIWGPDIELVETSNDLESFLGEEKYKPTLMAIYATLGIPPTLTGTFGAQGTTNNFISLKTLTERLNYVRDIVIRFWNKQIAAVQQAMGFRLPAQVEFDYMYLDDPVAMATLLLNMADRNLVSDEFVQKYVKAKPKIERRRVTKENKVKEEKVSPYHTVDKDYSLKKTALQTGLVTPSELGLELEPRLPGEVPVVELKNKQTGELSQVGQPGRPKNSLDTKKRKTKEFKPVTKASLALWAKTAQDYISATLNPVVVAVFNKKSVRGLTNDELRHLESLKFEVLCNLSIENPLTQESVAAATKNPQKEIHADFSGWTKQAAKLFGTLNIDQIRNLRISYYVNRIIGDNVE